MEIEDLEIIGNYVESQKLAYSFMNEEALISLIKTMNYKAPFELNKIRMEAFLYIYDYSILNQLPLDEAFIVLYEEITGA